MNYYIKLGNEHTIPSDIQVELEKYVNNTKAVEAAIHTLVNDAAIHDVGYSCTDTLKLSFGIPCKITVTRLSEDKVSVELDF
jgi:hypothetical protein